MAHGNAYTVPYREVARAAGVSVSSVQLTFRGARHHSHRLRTAKALRILEVAESMSFLPKRQEGVYERMVIRQALEKAGLADV